MTVILKGIQVVFGAVSWIFFPRTEALEQLLSPKWAAAWCSLEPPGYKETLSTRPFYAREHLAGGGLPFLPRPQLSSALLQLPTSPERTGGFCFRQLRVDGVYPPLPVFTWERGATHDHWVPSHLDSERHPTSQYNVFTLVLHAALLIFTLERSA